MGGERPTDGTDHERPANAPTGFFILILFTFLSHIINLLSLHFIYSLITFLFSSLLHLKFIIYIHFQDLEINYRSS